MWALLLRRNGALNLILKFANPWAPFVPWGTVQERSFSSQPFRRRSLQATPVEFRFQSAIVPCSSRVIERNVIGNWQRLILIINSRMLIYNCSKRILWFDSFEKDSRPDSSHCSKTLVCLGSWSFGVFSISLSAFGFFVSVCECVIFCMDLSVFAYFVCDAGMQKAGLRCFPRHSIPIGCGHSTSPGCAQIHWKTKNSIRSSEVLLLCGSIVRVACNEGSVCLCGEV